MIEPLSGKLNKLETSLMLPLNNIVILPEVALPITLTDSYSIGVVEAALLSNHKQLVVATTKPEFQRELYQDKHVEIESLDDIYSSFSVAESFCLPII